jgi:hypothetical protein
MPALRRLLFDVCITILSMRLTARILVDAVLGKGKNGLKGC